jgi:hypothetical protein
MIGNSKQIANILSNNQQQNNQQQNQEQNQGPTSLAV